MCPDLARRGYYLGVLNEPAPIREQRLQAGDVLSGEMHRMLVRLAEHVRDKTTCSPAELQVLNLIFDRYSAVKLKIVPLAEEELPAYDPAGGPLRRAKVRAVIGGSEGEQARRIYFEAIVSLLEALENGPLELGQCEECGAWFEPYSRAPVTKFCSARCRNRFNYKARKQTTAAGVSKGSRERDSTEVAP